jgi:hypothetical protein
MGFNSGKANALTSVGPKGAFGTELARFQPFDAVARGGVSVAVAQIDGTTSDNIIVGSPPGIPSEVKVYQSQLSSSAGAINIPHRYIDAAFKTGKRDGQCAGTDHA